MEGNLVLLGLLLFLGILSIVSLMIIGLMNVIKGKDKRRKDTLKSKDKYNAREHEACYPSF